ncbi:transposon-transfer assisting family protein [Ruminococcaceae bacterium OttesenSCG-928-L11]|nr:transposon-transfer assisting family protein [Ruminococcaceae bacterium OttesenSCG-928-L11]
MNEIFTAEEINLMCIYDTSSRGALLSDLKLGLADVYDPDMREIFHTAITKLEALTDTDFSDIGFYIADEYMDDEGAVIGE